MATIVTKDGRTSVRLDQVDGEIALETVDDSVRVCFTMKHGSTLSAELSRTDAEMLACALLAASRDTTDVPRIPG